MSVIFVHPTGNPNVRAALRGTFRAGLLTGFVTALAPYPDRGLMRLLPGSVRRQLRLRAFQEIPPDLVRTHPLREAVRLAATRLGWTMLTRHETGWASTDRVYQTLDRQVAKGIERRQLTARAVYAYDDGALDTFRAAGRQDMLRIYELPIADWRTIRAVLAEEAELQPAWAMTLDALRDSPAKLARKDAEIEEADQILVPCRYAREGLIATGRTEAARVHCLPYAAPPVSGRFLRERRPGECLRIVYVGQLRQRKGLSYLLAAVENLDRPYELTLVGPRPALRCEALDRALERHSWVPPIPHADVLKLLHGQDVMVFPSLCEGFGLVILEAMAQGVPVITTPHTGGPHVIDNGVDGFIIPIRDPDAIAAKLALLADDPSRLGAMAEAARHKAAAHSWRRYEDRLAGLVRSWLPC